MQTYRPAAGAVVPAIEPIDTPEVAQECRRLRVVARIDDAALWQAAATRLLECGRRRWRTRTDIADQPAVRRWSRIQDLQEIPERPSLPALFAAVAAGAEIAAGDPYADFAAAIMLLASCPAEVVLQSDPRTEPRAVRFSVFAQREDDLPLAEDLITTTLRSCGAVLARRCTVLRRGPSIRPPAPLVDHPLPELLVLGSGTAAR
ncbi:MULTISPECIES: hypothetical protein [Nocardia]|uniref:hypothetical protein n=1 Tax=Nocardia TaxID=1817 RepID=UPI002930C3A0|nr:hypothetical protein [Nocardia canadensis]